MDRSVRDGTFASLEGFDWADRCLLTFEEGQPILHLDMPLTEALEIQNRPYLHGFTRNGSHFVATKGDSFHTMGRVTVSLDDLVIELPEHDKATRFHKDLVRTVFVFFDPVGVDDFFFKDFHGISYALDGQPLTLSGGHLVDKYAPETLDDLTLSLTTRSALYIDSDSISHSTSERICLRLDFDQPTVRSEVRRKIASIQTLIEAIGRPTHRYLRELFLLTESVEDHPVEPVEWWSRGLLGDRRTVPDRQHDPLRSGGFADSRPPAACLHEMGDLAALAQWTQLCERVPHLLSVLDTYRQGLAIDARSTILSLAVAWEHLAAYSRGSAQDAAWREIKDLVTRQSEDREIHGEMIELCWNTYLQIKHVTLRSSNRVTIPDSDPESQDAAAEFMYFTVLYAAFELAGISQPYPVEFNLFARDEDKWWPEWTRVADKYRTGV